MRQPDAQTEADDVKATLDLYVSLPDTPRRARRDDHYLARQLHRQSIPLLQVEAAMLLATARRVFRDEPEPLEPVRSLRYFVPALEEVRQYELNEGYVYYLRDKLSHVLEPKPPPSSAPRPPPARQLRSPW